MAAWGGSFCVCSLSLAQQESPREEGVPRLCRTQSLVEQNLPQFGSSFNP